MGDLMRERGAVVNSAAQMLASGEVNLDTLPLLIKRIINEDMWRQRAIPQERWRLTSEFHTFEEFVTAGPLDGLGTTVQMIKDLCRRDTSAQIAIDKVTQHTQGERREFNNIKNSPPPMGTTQAQALRRLRKDRPDLLARVETGELSAHAAAVEAGFRPRTITVRADDPRQVARTLRKHMTPENLDALGRLLFGAEVQSPATGR